MNMSTTDEQIRAALEVWYGKPYPCGDNVVKDMADMRKVAAILASPAAVSESTAPVDARDALTEDALMLDIDGDDPLSDELIEVWLEAQDAAAKCMPAYLMGHTEWCERVQAACKVLIAKLPAIYRRTALTRQAAAPAEGETT